MQQWWTGGCKHGACIHSNLHIWIVYIHTDNVSRQKLFSITSTITNSMATENPNDKCIPQLQRVDPEWALHKGSSKWIPQLQRVDPEWALHKGSSKCIPQLQIVDPEWALHKGSISKQSANSCSPMLATDIASVLTNSHKLGIALAQGQHQPLFRAIWTSS